MAEIPVEKKSSAKWLWILLAAVLIGLLVWWATDRDETLPEEEIVGENTVGTDPMTPAEPVAMEGGVTIAGILGNPTDYIGRNDVSLSGVTVGEVPTDRGFWIQEQGERLFVVIIDQPNEVPADINASQQLAITQAMARDASFIGNIPGVPIDADTRSILESQDVYLVVDESNVDINPAG